MSGVSLFVLLLNPTLNEDGTIQFILERFGPSGMITALLVGVFVALVMNLCNKFSFFKKGSSLPEFIMDWFDFLVPIALILTTGWVLVYPLHFALYWEGVSLSCCLN
ncbi:MULTISPECIES: hypothetical protein [unclassified Paenibacillus]|uniref:hypothetical protein n=1 Tax=unclassified Paenibacillus TaxID=185978 RepID=UPI00240654DE|nr:MULTISPECIES: hypothetical protein [unclassified Paenibacillus]MDF9843661.1 cellobiose-specific phosphotransferase system component IIC [Paenibacillus sp. PastF-2]MDF9850249.1 cellobiose-specific phosphotransferase system component IIC [Paenibacillus sp. PastM-2]MDF9856811.1 cellobiose-specific phosphotransferase system component IIC [Paenibacillus sp. PastF-1]MDH6482096.1 cellobiose-specific phosphotransferase system component IIC [Paenibacillus sp. PastH-2]MDH6509519.1 cellobiose-specific